MEFVGYLVDIFVRWLDVIIFVSNVFIDFILNFLEGSEDGIEFVRWIFLFFV